MSTTTRSIHPGMKALVTGCSLALLSAFVWFSHTQAQSKSTPSDVAQTSLQKAKSDGATKAQSSSPQAATTSDPVQSVTQAQREIMMLSSKSYTGTTVIKAETLSPIKDKTPDADTKLFRSDKLATKPDVPNKTLMSGSKTMIITTSILAPVSKDGQNPSQPNQAPGASPQPVVPKDVLMFSSKAMSQPVFSTRKVSPDSQKAAPPVQQQKSEQK